MNEAKYVEAIDDCIANLKAAKNPKAMRDVALASADVWLKEAIKLLERGY